MAPEYLTIDKATEHAAAAEIAGGVTHENPALLLAIAWHESNYTSNYVQPESDDPDTGAPRWSCGVMTPAPQTTPCASRSLVDQYIDGARHLALWRERWHAYAIDAYAGGNWLADGCSRGRPVMHKGRNLCTFHREMETRALSIWLASGIGWLENT